MRKIAFLTGILAMAAAFAVPVVYRNPLDVRSWAVVFDRSAPLAWHWADGAVSATLTFSNIVTRQTASTTVERGASFDGSCALPSIVPAQGQGADALLIAADAQL